MNPLKDMLNLFRKNLHITTETERKDIEAKFNELTTRKDIGILIINQDVGDTLAPTRLKF